MPKAEVSFDEAVAAKVRTFENMAKKKRSVRLRMKAKQKQDSSSDTDEASDCNSSLSSESSSCEAGPDVADDGEHGGRSCGLSQTFVFVFDCVPCVKHSSECHRFASTDGIWQHRRSLTYCDLVCICVCLQ